jgi:hypothetical protein
VKISKTINPIQSIQKILKPYQYLNMASENTEYLLKVLLLGTCELSKAFFQMILQKYSLDDVYVPITGKTWRVFHKIINKYLFRVYIQDTFTGISFSNLESKSLLNWDAGVLVFDCNNYQDFLNASRGLEDVTSNSTVFFIVIGIVFNDETREVRFDDALRLCEEFNVLYTELDLISKDFSFEILEILIQAKFSPLLQKTPEVLENLKP